MKRICAAVLILCLLLPAVSLAWRAGDEVVFGSYEQDGNILNGKEPIQWIVLKSSGNELTLLSKYVLDARTFSGGWDEYSASTIRRWLTEIFVNDAFSYDEQRKIIPATGRNDKVWLLHANEVSSYNLSRLGAIYGIPTEYAIDRGLEYDGFVSAWWLRGSNEYKVNIVSLEGKVSAGNVYPSPCNNVLGVRPAIVVQASAVN